MKKKLFISLLVGLLCFTLVGCGKTDNKKGEKGKITLETYGGVPENWQYTIEDPSIVAYDSLENDEIDKDAEGGRVKQYFYFKGLKEGKTTIKFEYTNVVTNKISDTKTYSVSVDKNLNVTIK